MKKDGKKIYVDKRNWKEYNEKLVKRGELYLDLGFLSTWDDELERLNKDKKGRPFEFPPLFIKFNAFIHHIFYLPYRQLEGFLRKLSEFINKLKAADYTTLFKRIAELDLNLTDTIPQDKDDVIIALDSSGIKVTNRGEWIREKWKRRRGWIKVHLAVDTKKKRIVGIEITDESVKDNEKFGDLIKQSQKNLGKGKIKRVLADGNYDTKEDFNILEQEGIEAGIKIREDASTKARGSPYRAYCVREFRKLGYEGWRDKYGYGDRWAVEGVFSAVKRIAGESVRSTSVRGMFREVIMKFVFYNILLNVC